MNKDLALLDRMEEIRQKASENPANYPVDYTIRLLSAMVAAQAGYKSRTDWTEQLKKYPESNYSTRLAENRFHV